MAPSKDKSAPHEGKQRLFSFLWLLRKSKSSRSAKEMSQGEKNISTNVPTSKSCDAGLTTLEAIDRCPTFLLWKLLPPAGKNFGQSTCRTTHKLPFRSSFSCNDVHTLATTTTNGLMSAESTREMCMDTKSTKSVLRQPSQSCYKLYKSSNSDVSSKTLSQYNSNEMSSQNVLCKLCLLKVPTSKLYTLQDCKCVFCITCLHQYLTINIKEGNVPVTCPDANCSTLGKILLSEIKEIAGDDALYMFERYKLNLDVDLDPTRVWCPSAGCETICTFQPNSKPDLGIMVYCNNCRLKFCSSCKLKWHGKATCEEALSDEIELSMSEDESWIKRCPNCRIPIEKDEGCAQMMCYRCKHVFCWHCLASLDEDFLLRHYDRGPCRNKLGHTRASMIWHRTQVVGIFAGFSFLLLVASPFILLAAPCLLCCRCKDRLLYDEATSI